MSSRPNLRVLFLWRSHQLGTSFDDLEDDVIPVLPITRSIQIKNCSVRRRQIPVCPAFGLTDYKAQGQTFTGAILDLKSDGIRGRDPHYRFCSFYVQLSRLRSSKHLYLLRRIQLSDIDFKPHPELVKEMSRLQALEVQTLEDWATSCAKTVSKLYLQHSFCIIFLFVKPQRCKDLVQGGAGRNQQTIS